MRITQGTFSFLDEPDRRGDRGADQLRARQRLGDHRRIHRPTRIPGTAIGRCGKQPEFDLEPDEAHWRWAT